MFQLVLMLYSLHVLLVLLFFVYVFPVHMVVVSLALFVAAAVFGC